MFGSPLEYQAKQIAFNVYRFYRKRKSCKDTEEYLTDVNLVDKVAEVTGISRGTIQKIVKEGNDMESEYGVTAALFRPKAKNTKIMKKRLIVDNITEGQIRRKALKITTMKKLNIVLKEENILHCSKEYLRQLMHKLKFSCTALSGILVENSGIVTERQNYLEAIRRYRDQERSIFYLSETKRWTTDDDATKIIEMPNFVIVHISGTAGFLDKTNFMLKMKPNSKDDECFEHFENYDWIKDIVLKNIPERSVIVINIPFCETPESMLQDEKPTADSPKYSLENWLKRHNIPFDETKSESELLELINSQEEKMEYSISKIITDSGHEILHLPQYHSDLNPVAVMWHDIKEIAQKKSAKELFVNYPIRKWEDCLTYVKENEDEYYSYFIKNIKNEKEKEDLLPTTSDKSDNDKEEGMESS